MMYNNYGGNYMWGMHMGWWLLILALIIIFAGWFGWFRKRK